MHLFIPSSQAINMTTSNTTLAAKKPVLKIFSPLKDFFNDSRAGGILLILCTVASLMIANTSSLQEAYTNFWAKDMRVSFLNLPENPLTWVNDVLMAFFFFFVGMEIKRELMTGELSSVKKSLLPIMAAVGGMVCPAIIFWFFNGGTEFRHGWGIPMATDIAFSLAIVSLLGKKVPVQLKIFLAALAIIDDLGAVVTIAIFYSSTLNFLDLGGALLCFFIVMGLNKLKPKNTLLYLVPAVLMWYCLFNSGIHATIAGVVMAFSMPLDKLAKVEHLLHKPVNFFIMPLFALANTAILLPSSFSGVYTSSVAYGIMLGLIIGKPVGIFLFSFIASKTGIADMPGHSSYKQLLGIGMLGGIGFTMSIFTSSLAYNLPGLLVVSKVAIITGSIGSGIIGYFYLLSLKGVAAASSVEADTIRVEPKQFQADVAIG